MSSTRETLPIKGHILRRRSLLIALSLGVVVIVVVAGITLRLVSLDSRTSGPRADGPTFYNALSSVNVSLAAQPGGPWFLSQVFGVASPVPSSPSVFGWGEYTDTLEDCQAAFNGLTLWNGTIPLFNGTFNSGTAPFWQLVFYSNASQEILIATDVLGVVHYYSPIAMSSPCAISSGLGYEPWVSSWTFYRWAFPRNTPTMAQSAWNAIARTYLQWLGQVPTEMFYMGDLNFGSGQPSGTQTKFFTCGTEGAVGATRGLDVLTDSNDTAQVTGWYNYTFGCTPTYDNWTSIPVDMEFSNLSLEESASGLAASESIQLLTTGGPMYSGSNTKGITSWMIGFTLTDAGGQRLQLVGSDCSAWVPTLGDCLANTSGWYAVLLSGGGDWLGSFGASLNGPRWDYPVIPFASNQTLAVVIPSGWNVSGDTLEVAATTINLPLTGSSVLS